MSSKLLAILAVAAMALFVGCSRQHSCPGIFFYPVEVKEHKVDVNISHFPDNVQLFFCSENFAPENAMLTEIVDGKGIGESFSASRIIPDTLKYVIFIEDCSGSMLEHITKANYIIYSIAKYFGDVNIGLVRVGKHSLWAQNPIEAPDFLKIKLDELEYPKPNGTSLAEALKAALDTIQTAPALIVLIADGSIAEQAYLWAQVETAILRKIPIVAMQMDGKENPILQRMSRITNGFFTTSDGTSLEEVIFGGWYVRYSPGIADTNGVEHHVVLRWGSHKRIGAYKAPGTPPSPIQYVESEPDIEQTPELPIIPAELIVGMRIPFVFADNIKLISPTRMSLDSLVGLIEKAPLPEGTIIRIEGYTCNLGERKHNYDLSVRRAKATALYIRSRCNQGVKYEIVGHGEDDPLMPNTCEANRKANRRSEVRLILPNQEIRVQR